MPFTGRVPCSLRPWPHCTPKAGRIAPLIIVRHGRVAVGDAVALALGAQSVAMLIGERPGLSAPDSMGAYLTFKPHAHTSDADRNCISNIRPQGIDYAAAGSRSLICYAPCAPLACPG